MKNILGEYTSFFSFQVRETIYTSTDTLCITTTSYPGEKATK